MPEHRIHWTALPRGADASGVELDVFVSPRLGVDALATEYTLADFPEFETWTARVAAGELAFEVVFDGGTPVPATIVAQDPLDEDLWKHLFPSTSPVEPWSFRDHSGRAIRSFPARWTLAYLRHLYKRVGQAGGVEMPTPEQLDPLRPDLGGLLHTDVGEEHDLDTEQHGPVPGGSPTKPRGCLIETLILLCLPLRRLCRWLRKLLGLGSGPSKPGGQAQGPVEFRYRPPAPRPTNPYEKLEEAIAAQGIVPPAEVEAEEVVDALEEYPVREAFAQALCFYDRPEMRSSWKGPPDIEAVPPSPAEPRWEFHRRLGALGDYPTLMQRLGLTIRIRVPRPQAASGAVRVVPRVAGATRPAVDITPATAYTLDGERFHARPRLGSDLAAGMLNLAGADDRLESAKRPFDLVQVDADGTVLKAIVAATSLERRAQVEALKLGFDGDEREPLPALRTAGIAIVRDGRAAGLQARLKEAQEHWLAQGGKVLHADEVVRGYEVWVQREGGNWHSLCERAGVYRLVDDEGELIDPSAVRTIEDHGYVKRSGATSKDETSDLYLNETLVRWTGWSLVAPLPGKTVIPVHGTRVDSETGKTVPTQGEVESATVSTAADGFRVETRFAPAQKSLPRLRFGDSYRFAMAWVDLAGRPLTQLAKGPGADAPVSEPIVFRRFEPLAPPSVLPFGAFKLGNSLERLVVRSDYDRSPAEWLAGLSPSPGLDERDERRLFAPKTSQQMAELHGRFDHALGPTGDHAAGFALGVREKGKFEDPAVLPFGSPDTEADGTVVNRDPDAVLPAPYLPDPMAAGIALRDVPNLKQASDLSGDQQLVEVVTIPGLARPVLRIRFGGAWPDLESVRVRAVGSDPSAGPHWDAAKRLLTIHLPKGAEAEVRYSCYLDAEELEEKMGVWDWLDDEELPDDVRRQARSSVHWMIAPWRTLTLVHALQHPLDEAKLGEDAVAKRVAGESVATIEATATVDATTDRVDLEARWEDWRDEDLKAPEFVKEPHEAVVGHWTHERDKMPPPPPAAGAPMPPQRQEFGDTRHRRVFYSLRATSRFREYLPVGLELDRPGSQREVSVPASAPPDPPRISYAVPAFGWHQDEGPTGDAVLAVGKTLRRTRLGGGLRVFLERPWYSSGEGERLAVVLKHEDDLPPALQSRVGIDPTVGESAWPEAFELTPAAFTGANTAQGVLLSERPTRVAIASFEPRYDKGRRLWACDVTLDMAALPWGDWPFVRLALARHQPEAVEGCHLSKVVPAQWAQLAPDRHLIVKRTSSEVKVTLSGRGRKAPLKNRLVVAIEHAAGPFPDELEWRSQGGGAPPKIDADLWQTDAIEPDVFGDELVWSKDVTVPSAGGGSLRLTVRELEYRQGEGNVSAGAVRLVYADTVRLA